MEVRVGGTWIVSSTLRRAFTRVMQAGVRVNNLLDLLGVRSAEEATAGSELLIPFLSLLGRAGAGGDHHGSHRDIPA